MSLAERTGVLAEMSPKGSHFLVRHPRDLIMIIRPEQMDVFATQMREDYIKRTLQSLVQLFPNDDEVKDEAAMRRLIDYAIARAQVYGIECHSEVSLFIFLAKGLTPEFEKQIENRWIEEILLDKELEAREKMDLIYRRLELAPGNS